MIRVATLLLCAVSLTGCSYLGHGDGPDGNPSGTPYAGEPGSVFDSSGTPRSVVVDQVYAPAPMSAQGPITSGTLPPVSQAPNAAPR